MAQENLQMHCEMTACRDERSQSEEKSKGCDKFDSVPTVSRTDVKPSHTGRESECHLSRYAAYCVHNPSSISVHLGILCAERHTRSAGSLLSFHSWNVHDYVQEPDLCDLHKLLHLHMRRALGRGDVAVSMVMFLLAMSCCWCELGLDSSVIDNVFGVLSFVLSFLTRRQEAMYHCVQTIAPSGFGFCIFLKFKKVVFPSFGWSSCSPVSLFRDDESWIPLTGSSSNRSPPFKHIAFFA